MEERPVILCFSWNTDGVSLCDRYYLNDDATRIEGLVSRRERFKKNINCYNPLFFDTVGETIINATANIVVFSSEGDLASGTYFHSDFLPLAMKNLPRPFKLLTRDKYSAERGTIRLSIYVLANDQQTKVIELNKGFIFNDNTFKCLGPRERLEGIALALYIETYFGTFSFITVQLPDNINANVNCFEAIETKFVRGKNTDYVFLLGDFAETYSNDFQTIKTKRNTSPLVNLFNTLGYTESNHINEPNYVTARKPLTNKFLDNESNLIYNSRSNPDQVTSLGYHNRIFFKKVNPLDRHYEALSAVVYTTVYSPPMLKDLYSKHLGIMGVYELKR